MVEQDFEKFIKEVDDDTDLPPSHVHINSELNLLIIDDNLLRTIKSCKICHSTYNEVLVKYSRSKKHRES